MRQFATWTMLLFALLSAAGCQTTAPASECDGWRELTPAPQTRDFIIRNDRPFAEQVAGHNSFGTGRGCWE
ncbi:hypothetical protein [Chelativorans sp.]|uniref:hypothetical protein n=1 Tax=Chelativorans sp. TaxID=2203393 RepID=UPI0028122200|nr:hypothetical protein [Chelativorans sp.]